MKNYKITVIEQKTKKVVDCFTELSNSLKYLKAKYTARYRFETPKLSVNIERLIRKPGIQTDLLTLIEEELNDKGNIN